MKLKKLGRAKTEDGIKLDFVNYGSDELEKEGEKRLGSDCFYILTHNGEWRRGYEGSFGSRIYALTPEDRKKFNEWEEPKPPVQWITDRLPTEDDAGERGKVAIYNDNIFKKWETLPFDLVNTHALPWARITDVEQYTPQNPAPHPHTQINKTK